MKKILSAVLCAAMIITAMPVALAGNVRDMLINVAGFEATELPLAKSVSPEADIKVKKSTDAAYVDDLPAVYNDLSVTFDVQATLDMARVKQAFNNWFDIATGYYGAAEVDFDNLDVSGLFNVDITYPKSLNLVWNNSNPVFDFAPNGVFKEGTRTLISGAGETDTLRIPIIVKSPADPLVESVKAGVLRDNLDTYFQNITLTYTGVAPTTYGSYEIVGEITGYTDIKEPAVTVAGEPDHVGKITYDADQKGTGNGDSKISETIDVIYTSGGGTNVSGGGSGATTPSNKVTVEFVSAGETHHTVTKVDKVIINVDEVEKPEREGFAFAGWYDDEQNTIPVTGEINVTEHNTIHAKWINTSVPSALNNDRSAYVIGYPDGDVRPNDDISREEIATIFYRLLKKEIREELYAEENSFADVEADRWSNSEISTMANGKYIVGYEDGTFRPENAITRGEFVTIAARFLEETVGESYKTFSDINDHWAEDAIHAVADQEWIGGYEDGSFRPDALITRAEAMTIINRMLVYHIDHDTLIDEVKHWPDNNISDWFYLDVLTATNTRDHSIRENGYTEDWHDILPNPDWSVIK